MGFEGEPSSEVHKGDQLLALFGLQKFAFEPIDVGDGLGAVHQARDYPYVTPHPKARDLIDSMLAVSKDDPRYKIMQQAGTREMAKRLNLVPDPNNEGEWVKADGTPPASGY